MPITDHEHILISALRYALGRRTYIVSITTKYIEREIPTLSEQCKAIMIEDIEHPFMCGYGDACDKKEWMKLLQSRSGFLAVKLCLLCPKKILYLITSR